MIAIAAVVLPGFMLWGIGDEKASAPKNAGSIGSQKISTTQFVREYEALRRELELFYGIQSPAWLEGTDLQELTWQRMLLVRAARDQGIRVSNDEVIEWIQKLPVFTDSKGQFSQERYSSIIQNHYRVDERHFEENTRDFLVLRKIREKIRGQAQVSDTEIRSAFERTFAAKDLEYAVLSDAELPSQPVLTDVEVQETYELFKGRMMNPESVQVRYITLPSAGAVPSEPSEVDRLFADGGYQTAFISKEDPIPGIGVAEALSEAFFKLKSKGERTEWIPSGDKQYRFELVERKALSPMTFEEAEGILRKELLRRKTLEALLALAQSVRKEAAESGLPTAAEKHGLAVLRQAGFKSGDYLQKVGTLPAVDAALQKMGLEELSEPIAVSNGWLIARVSAVGAVDESLWEKKKDSLRQELLSKREAEIFQTQMDTLRANLKINTETMDRLFPSRAAAQPPSPSAAQK